MATATHKAFRPQLFPLPNEAMEALVELISSSDLGEFYQRCSAVKTATGQSDAALEPLFRAVMNRVVDLDRLRRLADTDALTQLANRRAFFAALRREFSRRKRKGVLVSVLLLDLDGLKTLNDSAGHEAGDRAIKAAARCAEQAVRDCDLVARLGGDEFVVLLPDTDEIEAGRVATRVRERVESVRVAGFRLRASIGVATTQPDDVECNVLLNRADVALYRDKQRRRAQSTLVNRGLLMADCQAEHSSLWCGKSPRRGGIVHWGDSFRRRLGVQSGTPSALSRYRLHLAKELNMTEFTPESELDDDESPENSGIVAIGTTSNSSVLPYGMHEESVLPDVNLPITAQPSERAPDIANQEEYDSVRPEELGREWLNRATEGEPIPSPESEQSQPLPEIGDPSISADYPYPIGEASFENALGNTEERVQKRESRAAAREPRRGRRS